MQKQIVLLGYACNRCGHKWVPKKKGKEDPRVCPKCHSPYYNKPRRHKKKQKALVIEPNLTEADNVLGATAVVAEAVEHGAQGTLQNDVKKMNEASLV